MHAEFSGCTSLASLPDELNVGKGLYLSGCTKIVSLPADMDDVRGNLDVSNCVNLKNLPAEILCWQPCTKQVFINGSGLSNESKEWLEGSHVTFDNDPEEENSDKSDCETSDSDTTDNSDDKTIPKSELEVCNEAILSWAAQAGTLDLEVINLPSKAAARVSAFLVNLNPVKKRDL